MVVEDDVVQPSPEFTALLLVVFDFHPHVTSVLFPVGIEGLLYLHDTLVQILEPAFDAFELVSFGFFCNQG